jgi:hypothetical protein
MRCGRKEEVVESKKGRSRENMLSGTWSGSPFK